jgi:hypothetical protein
MINENAEIIKADAKKAVSDLGNIMSHSKADVEKMRAKFGHGDQAGKKAAYAQRLTLRLMYKRQVIT